MSKIDVIKEIYGLKEDDLALRREALEKLAPFADEILDKFYDDLMKKPEFAAFIPEDQIPVLKKKQIAFVAALLSEPFDEKLYTKIAKVGIVHYHIRLDPIYMSYGYHLLSKLILAQSQKDPTLLPYLKLVIKYLKVAEAIMSDEYFAQKNLAESPYKANNLSLAVNQLQAAYMPCAPAIHAISEGKKRDIDEKKANRFRKRLEALNDYRDVLLAVGIDLAQIRRHCTQLLNAEDEKKRQKEADALRHSIESALNNLSVTSFLSLSSALSALEAMTDIVYRRAVARKEKEAEVTVETIRHNVTRILSETFGWALADIDIVDEEPKESYDIVKHLYFPDEKRMLFLVVNVRSVANRIYVLEATDLLAEAMKLTIFLRAKAKEIQ